MKLNKITFTGADDTISPEKLLELSAQYPIIEWGILFSKNKIGTPRYPSRSWLQWLKDIYTPHLQLSAHLCGEYSRLFQQGVFNLAPLENHFKRIQINMTDDAFIKLDMSIVKSYATPLQIILQTKRNFERAEEVTKSPQITFLYDISGGKGIKAKEYPKPPENKIVGYAGGLGPDNLKEELEKLNNVVKDSIIWIDAETKLRNQENKFDLDIVKKVLQLCEGYI